MKQKTKLRRMLSLLFVAICASTVAFGVGVSAWSLMTSSQNQWADNESVATSTTSYAAPAKAPAATRTFDGLAENAVAVIPDGNSYTEYTDLAEAFYDASAGQTVVLVKDLDISVTQGADQFCAEIPNSITFDGNGNTLTVNRRGISVAPQSNNVKGMFLAPAAASTYGFNVTIQNVTIQNTAAQSRGYGGRCITTRGKLGSLTLDNVILTTDGSNYNNTISPIFIGGSQATAATINVTNSSIITDADAAKGDAITTINPIVLNITGSTLTAANVINFGEADESAGSNGSTVNVAGSMLTASVAAFHFYDSNIAVDLASSTVTGAVAEFESTSDNAVAIAGGQFSQVVDDALLAEGYICHKVASDGLYLVEEGTYSCYIDEVGYPTLAEAIACTPNNSETTITMQTDETIDVPAGALTIAAGKIVVLELAGHSIVGSCASDGTSALITNKGSLTIQDNTDTNKDGTGNGKLIAGADLTWTWDGSDDYSGSYASNLIRNEGSLVVESGFLSNISTGSAAYAIDNYTAGAVTINGGQLVSAKASAIRMFFNNGGSLTITGGVIGGENSYMGVQVQGTSTNGVDLNLSGGTYNGQYAVYAGGGTEWSTSNVNITGGTYNSYVCFTGTLENVSVSGGEFNSWVGSYGDVQFISGGSFANQVEAMFCTDGFVCSETPNEEGKYVVTEGRYVALVGDYGYLTLTSAINAAVETEDALVTLTDDAAVEGVVAQESVMVAIEGKSVTIDLDGLTLQSNALQLNAGSLTFSNGNVTGTVVANGGSLAFDDSCGTNDIAFTGNEALNLTTGKFANDINEQYLAAHYATNLISGAYVVKATEQIATVEDLLALAALVNKPNGAATSGNTYELTADLDLTGVTWIPIGNLAAYPGRSFQGTFDGKGHTISNLTCVDNTANHATAALFGGTKNAIIKNLTLSNVDIQSTHYAAAFVAYTSDGTNTIENCHVKGGSIVSTPELIGSSYDNGDKVGSIVGYTTNFNIINCSVEDVTLQAYRDLGGLAGFITAGNVTGNTLKDVTLTQDNTNGYKKNANGSLQDMSTTVGLVVGGRSAEAIKTQANDVAQNTTENVVITAPVVIAKIGDATYATLAAAVAAAQAGDVVEICKADTYTLPSLPQNITVKGVVDGVVFSHTSGGNIASIPNGATFENVTFEFDCVNYHGFQHAGTINMKDCTLNGKLFSYADMNFDGCTFNAPASDYSMWAYSGNLTYTDCTFNCPGGKCVNVYNESGTALYTIAANGCTFNSEKTNKAAFNVKATCGSTPLAYEVVIEDCEATGSWPAASESSSLVVLNALVQVDDINPAVASVTDVTQITNGVEEVLYTTRVAEYNGTRYDTLKEALDAAKAADEKDIVINLLNDGGQIEIQAWEAPNNTLTIGGANTETITINGNGHTLDFKHMNGDWDYVATTNTETKLILNDMNITGSGKDTGHWKRTNIFFHCAVEMNDVTSTAIGFESDAKLSNVTINDNRTNIYGIWIKTCGQNVEIDGLTINTAGNGGRGIAIKDEDSDKANGTTLEITNATFTTDKKAAILVTASYTVKIEASNLDIANVAADNENAIWVDEKNVNIYDHVTLTGDATMIPEGGVDAYTVVRSTGETVNGYYTDLTKAVGEAEDGQTVTLKADFDLAAAFLTLDKGITIDGQGHTIASSAAQAVLLTGSGDITFENVNITASAGHGIQAGNDNVAYAGQLALTNSTLTVAKRGVRVYSENEGFGIAIENSTIQSNVADPTTAYTVGNDAMALSLGTSDNNGYTVSITNSELKGFSYVLNSVTSGSNLTVTMTGGKTYGRAAVNVWGSHNTFTLDGVEVHGLNNQTGPTEAFACIVENVGATDNTYNINGCRFVATLSDAAMNTSGSSATEQMAALRGTGSAMNITGETTYTCNSDERGGLLSDEAALRDNTVALDATAKASLAEELDKLAVIVVSDEPDENGMYSLTFQGVAQLMYLDNGAWGDGGYFSTLEAVFSDANFGDNSYVTLLADVELQDDVVLDCDYFLLAQNGHAITTNGHSIVLETGKFVYCQNEAADLFTTEDARADIVKSNEGDWNIYTAEHHEVAYTVDGETDYYYFEEVFDEGTPESGATVTLQKDITLVQSVSAANSFTLNFDGNTLSRGGYTITLANNVTVTTDEQVADYAALFVPADPTYMVVEAENDGNYTYTAVTKESKGIFELADADGSYNRNADVQAEKVSYTRSYDEDRVGKYQPWLLPFNYAITDEDAAQFTFYKINMIANAPEDGVAEESDKIWIFITPMKADDVLYANKPYLYVPMSAVDNYQFVSENVTLKAKKDGALISTETMLNRYSFYGTYGPTTLNDENFAFYMGTNSKLSYPEGEDITVGVFRWILRVESKEDDGYVREIEFAEGCDATGIRFVEDGTEGETYYTLDGKKIQKPGRGIYVKKTADGEVKKVYIK